MATHVPQIHLCSDASAVALRAKADTAKTLTASAVALAKEDTACISRVLNPTVPPAHERPRSPGCVRDIIENMERDAFLNGDFIPHDSSGIHFDDIGLLRGYGVFEVIRTYNGIPFLLKEHLERLQNSAAILNLGLPHTQAEITETIHTLIRKNGFSESIIRIVLTGGRTADGMHHNFHSPTFFVLVTELASPPAVWYTEGIKLVTCEYQRDLPQAKTLNYVVAVKMQPAVKKEGAADLLYTRAGKVLESATSNFFIVKGKTLVTPKDDILIGVTRNLVLRLAQNGFDTEEREVSIKELIEADEAFITATNKDIVPVVKIDDLVIGDGKVGPATARLMNLFYDYTLSSS